MKYEHIATLEELTFNADLLSNMATALKVAMFESDHNADSFGGAMHLFTDILFQHKKDMSALLEEATAKMKAEPNC